MTEANFALSIFIIIREWDWGGAQSQQNSCHQVLLQNLQHRGISLHIPKRGLSSI